MHCRTQAGSQQDFKLLGHWLLAAGAFNKELKALLDFFIFTVLILVTSHSHHPCCLQTVLLLLELETGIFHFAGKGTKGQSAPQDRLRFVLPFLSFHPLLGLLEEELAKVNFDCMHKKQGAVTKLKRYVVQQWVNGIGAQHAVRVLPQPVNHK